MNGKLINWGIFVLICLIWGSSFILMKWGLYDAGGKAILSPYEVAALRLLSAGLVMLPFLRRALKNVPRRLLLRILATGWLGSFFPAFLFCIAETRIDSAFAGSLNSVTPLFVVITGALFFGMRTSLIKVVGVLIGLAGSGLLLFANRSHPIGDVAYAGLVLLATVFYGSNVNMIAKNLTGVPSVQIGTIAFAGLVPPSLVVLLITGYFRQPLDTTPFLLSTAASCILGVIGTALASVLFYVLVKRSGGLFASLVTYGIPFVAIGWGLYYGEELKAVTVLGLGIILAGVYVTNMPGKQVQKSTSS